MMRWIRGFTRWLVQPDPELLREFTLLKAVLHETRQEFKAMRLELHALDEKLSDFWHASGGTGGGIHG